jgi:hypothetical protein
MAQRRNVSLSFNTYQGACPAMLTGWPHGQTVSILKTPGNNLLARPPGAPSPPD